MGDMSAFFVNQALCRGLEPKQYRGDPKGDGHHVTCSKCGAWRLKWRATESGWRLFEDKRGEHNQKLEHQCGTATESDFEVLDGD